ncbi:hypothetical protein EUGRSUZ_A01429 [Eucalyptus grandis]|uniref:Uncharacterized protein n=2 Tax=Eucalyptus grandis TaxID=71139 RepID=A0ACC3M4H4_EUCGR|nr:hypothetical protein EUGRSUZ_A01429 [Eucalyptus grandis]
MRRHHLLLQRMIVLHVSVVPGLLPPATLDPGHTSFDPLGPNGHIHGGRHPGPPRTRPGQASAVRRGRLRRLRDRAHGRHGRQGGVYGGFLPDERRVGQGGGEAEPGRVWLAVRRGGRGRGRGTRVRVGGPDYVGLFPFERILVGPRRVELTHVTLRGRAAPESFHG